MGLKESIENLKATTEKTAAEEAERKERSSHPKGWEPGVVWSGTTGTVTTEPRQDEPKWSEYLEEWGFNPETHEVVEPIQFRCWDAQTPEGPRRFYYYKADIRSKMRLYKNFDLEAEIKAFKKIKKTPKQYTGSYAMVVPLADFQIGKSDGDGLEGTVQRILTMIDSVSDRIKELRKIGKSIDVLYVVGMGDLVENCSGNYAQQTFTVELNRRDQMKVARRLIRDALIAWSKLVNKVIVSAVAGNHGENRQGRDSYTDDADNDDVALFEQIAEIFAMNEQFDNVHFMIPNDKLTVVLDVNGTIIGFNHGHKARKGASAQKKQESWWQDQTFGGQPVGDADILVTGHYHHFSIVDLGPKLHIQCPAMDGGSKWWEDATGKTAKPGTVTFLIGEEGLTDIQIV